MGGGCDWGGYVGEGVMGGCDGRGHDGEGVMGRV